ncbi:MAG: RNA-directed DNA polymerase [Polyangiales bacterium]|jgi:RNA-directed DNA polymerase
MSDVLVKERAWETTGVWGAARTQGEIRNRRDPSSRLLSQQGITNKQNVKSCAAERESEEGIVLLMRAEQNVSGGKGLYFGSAGRAGTREGMAGTTRPNSPGGRKPPDVEIDKVRRLQRRLWVAAKRSPERRFHALFDRVYRSDVLWEAWRRVRRNRGSAGVDAQTLADVEQFGVERFLKELGAELREGKYKAKPVRRVYIPKADGKTRPLGIPAVRDRIAQMAVKLVMEPIFEADFRPCSFGFRPRRSATGALEELRMQGARGYNHVLDADIRDYFGSIDHERMMKLLARRISDRRVLKLLRQWLRAGVMENGAVTAQLSGTPQGGVISPLLSNIYLHVLDETWHRTCQHLGVLVRYADDFVIVCPTKAKLREATRRVKSILEFLKLQLHPDKTREVDLSWGKQGFDFLGCHLRKRLSGRIWEREGRRVYFLHRYPSARSMKRIRARVHALTSRKWNGVKDIRVLIRKLTPILRGWGTYFRTGNAAKKFNQLDGYVWRRLRRFLVKRHGRNLTAGRADGWMPDFFYAHGLHQLRGTVRYPGAA